MSVFSRHLLRLYGRKTLIGSSFLIQKANFISKVRDIPPLKVEEAYGSKFKEGQVVPEDFRHVYPEFLPDPKPEWRNRLRERIEREDMLTRRTIVDIPEFYVGSILSVTISDPNASGKTNKFVGICIQRGGTGLRAWFILRNVIDNLGVEIKYEMYCPLVLSIELLRLEKRLDNELLYLRDALPEFSTFPLDLDPEPIVDGAPVPINPIKVKLKPRPWRSRWERMNLQGVQDLGLPLRFYVWAKDRETPWDKYDLMKEYRATIPEEEQAMIYREMSPHMPRLEAARRKVRRVRIQTKETKKPLN